MSERHGGGPKFRAVAVSLSHRRSASGDTHQGTEWRQGRNGVPESVPYARSGQDAARDEEVAALVAAARAEALRRARKRLGPGRLERRTSAGSWARWEPVTEGEGAADDRQR